jgi:hypothetical protein
MAVFYSDSGSFSDLEVSGSVLISGSGQGIFSISGSLGPIFDVSDLSSNSNLFQLTSASVDVFKIDQSQNVIVNSNLIVSGNIYAPSMLESYYANFLQFTNTTNIAIPGTTNASTQYNYVTPFILPHDVSANFVRFFATNTWASTAVGTTANTTVGMSQLQTWWANFYALGTGAASRSIQQVAQASATMAYSWQASVGGASSNQTVANNVTFPSENSSYTAQTVYNVTNLSIQVSTTHLTALNSNRYLDLAFNSSLAAGAYWIALQRSTAVSTTGLAAFTNVTHNHSYFFQAQVNSNFAPIGQASNISTTPIEPGLGVWSTNTFGRTTNSMAFSQISTTANHPKIFFELIR